MKKQNNFDKVAEIDQNYAPAYFHKAKLLTNADDFDQAKKNYETAIDINDEYLEAHYYLKLLMGGKATQTDGSALNKKDLLNAKFHLSKVLEIDDSQPKAFYNLARIHFEEKHYSKAKSFLGNALKLEPRYSKAHYLLGRTSELNGDFEKAIHHYKRAIECHPDFPKALFHLGKLLFIQENHKMLKNLRLSIQLDPANPKSHYYLAKILSEDEDPNLAKNIFTKLSS